MTQYQITLLQVVLATFASTLLFLIFAYSLWSQVAGREDYSSGRLGQFARWIVSILEYRNWRRRQFWNGWLRDVAFDFAMWRELRRGRKINIHLLAGVQDAQVKTLGIEGQSSLRHHFAFLVEMRKLEDGSRTATFRDPRDDSAHAEVYSVPVLPDLDVLAENYALLQEYLGSAATVTGSGSSTTTSLQTATSAPQSHRSDVAQPVAPDVAPVFGDMSANDSSAVAPVAVSHQERQAIKQAHDMLAQQANGARPSMRSVCMAVYDGHTGGASFRKVQAVWHDINQTLAA